VGHHLARKLREGFKVFATYYKHHTRLRGVSYLPFNVENRTWVKRVIYSTHPDVVIFAAGHNRVDLAEKDPRGCERMHTGGPATISNTTDIIQPKFIYLSNSYVFDGNKGNYHESDIVLPSNALGKAKIGGENIVKAKSLNYIVLRSSPLYGRSNGTSLSTLDRLRMALDRGERIEVPDQELQSFAPIESLVEIVARLIDSGLKNKVIHNTGLTKMTLYEFCREFAKKFGYDPSLVLPIRAVRKPHPLHEEPSLPDYSLNATQTMELLKVKPMGIEEGLEQLRRNLIP